MCTHVYIHVYLYIYTYIWQFLFVPLPRLDSVCQPIRSFIWSPIGKGTHVIYRKIHIIHMYVCMHVYTYMIYMTVSQLKGDYIYIYTVFLYVAQSSKM